MIELIFKIIVYTEAVVGFFVIQPLVRRYLQSEEYRDKWIDFWVHEDWNVSKVVLYEIFFLDLITCRECSRINRHGTLCKECKEKIIKEEI